MKAKKQKTNIDDLLSQIDSNLEEVKDYLLEYRIEAIVNTVINFISSRDKEPLTKHDLSLLSRSLNKHFHNQSVQASVSFLEKLIEKELPIDCTMVYQGIGALSATFIAKAIERDAIVSLNLEDNRVGNDPWEDFEDDNEGLVQLTNAISSNTTLTSLNLSLNHIDEEGSRLLKFMLKENCTLKTLRLVANEQLGDIGTQRIAKALKVNNTLLHLDLRDCGIQDTGMEALTEALKLNTALQSLLICGEEVHDTTRQLFFEAASKHPYLLNIKDENFTTLRKNLAQKKVIATLYYMKNSVVKQETPTLYELEIFNVLSKSSELFNCWLKEWLMPEQIEEFKAFISHHCKSTEHYLRLQGVFAHEIKLDVQVETNSAAAAVSSEVASSPAHSEVHPLLWLPPEVWFHILEYLE
jgi:Ran GTPase-activating protein (RanGAP) involved in mRNA processing and transport